MSFPGLVLPESLLSTFRITLLSAETHVDSSWSPIQISSFISTFFAPYCTLYELSLLGYCLMSNHVHPVVTPAKVDSLPLTPKNTHVFDLENVPSVSGLSERVHS